MSGRLEVKIPSFYEAFGKTLSYYDIKVVKQDPKHLAKGWGLREKYSLTYFDSLQLKVSPFRAGMANSYELPKTLIIFRGALCLRVMRGR
jgi:predicted nucleic acid-binding protein